MNFNLICEIKPLKNSEASIVEYEPYKEYKNAMNKKLHKFGKGPFCKFRIPNGINHAGVYIIKVDNQVKYVGECEDLSSRYNMGYGQISPRNCFVGGQSTNCKINSFILQAAKKNLKIDLLFCQSQDRFVLERKLIELYKPEWNSTSGKMMGKSKVIKNSERRSSEGVRTMGRTIKYEPIKDYLMNCRSNRIQLTYDEIEKIIKKSLPDSAYKYREWWANGGHSQADAWLDAGWKVEEVNLGKSVVFIKDIAENPASEQGEIKAGKKYKHFKGNEYLVLHLAKHSETLEDLVVYQPLYGEQGIWVRPLSMFVEQVEVDGKLVKRFEECSE